MRSYANAITIMLLTFGKHHWKYHKTFAKLPQINADYQIICNVENKLAILN